MSIYIITLCLCQVTALFVYQKNINAHKNNSIGYNANSNYKLLFLIFSAFILFVVAFRADNIGIDTLGYINAYNKYHSGSNLLLSLKEYKWYQEIGYYFVMILFNNLGLSWRVFSLFMAMLFIVPIMYVIYQVSSNSFYGLTIFIMCGLWVYPMSTMRQAAAIGLTVLAFYYEEKKKYGISIILLLLASSFHISAIITVVYWGLRKIPFTKNNLKWWAISGILFIIAALSPLRSVLNVVMNMLGRDYQVVESTGGIMQEVFFVVTLIIGWMYCSRDERFWNYYKAVYLCAILLPIIRINPTLFRIYNYFSVYQVFLVPMILKNINQRDIKVIGYVAYFVVYVYLFMTQSMIASLKVIPYSFCWS